MADILKISTPLVDRLPINSAAARAAEQPAVPFDLSDVTRVIQTTDPSEILQQNTGFVPKENETPVILANLLKDPAVTASMIRNITILQEVLSLLPGTNEALTQEIEQLFEQLMMRPEDIAPELMRQEETTTLFKGDLFNTLRDLLAESTGRGTQSAAQGGAPVRPEAATSVGVLLKALNASISREDVLASVSNNLSFLADSLDASPRLFERLTELVRAFRAPDAEQNLPDLKEQVFAVLKDIESSVLFTPKMAKILPLVVYNLSRYNSNEDFLPDALKLLLGTMGSESEKTELAEKLQAYLDRVQPEGAGAARNTDDGSKVINTLAKIIGKQAESEDVQLVSGDRFEKIVHSLLSSPSNFTPLLHFVVPVEYLDMRAFAEIWMDPNAEGNASAGGANAITHMLMVFDVEELGRFESELFVQGKRIAMNLLCPPAHLDDFAGIGAGIRQAISALGYSFETINIDRLERTHSLMEVFTNLPHRRTGIDVKI